MAIVHISTAARNAAISAVAGLIDAGSGPGTLSIYGGTIPTDANTAVAAQPLLATIPLADPATGSPSNGVVSVSDPASDVWDASGTATWCRVQDSTGATVLDGDVTGTGGTGFLKLSTTTAVAGDPIDIQAGGTLTMPDGT